MCKGSHSLNVSSDKAVGLSHMLFISKQAKVMLSVNLIVPYGLFNGAMGTIVYIIYKANPRPTTRIFTDVFRVNFPSYTGPAFITDNPNVVPIIPNERRIDCRYLF